MDDRHPIEQLIHNSVDYLIKENTDNSWGEAIAIIISNMKDQKGLFCMPRLADDYTEHLRLCVVLASALRMYIDSNILASIPPNKPAREWQGLTDKEYEAMAEQHVTNCYFDTLTYAKAIEQALKEKNYGN